MAYINGKQVLFSPQVHLIDKYNDGYAKGFEDGEKEYNLITNNKTDFWGLCAYRSNIDFLSQIDTSKGQKFNYMFAGASKLKTIPDIDTSSGEEFGSMFNGCNALTALPNIDTSNGINFGYMCANCVKLTEVNIDTSSGKIFTQCFYNCKLLETVNNLTLTHSTDYKNIFYNCVNLKNLNLNGVIDLTGLDLSTCTALTVESLIDIIDRLTPNISESHIKKTLTLGTTNLDKLTDEQKAIATNKGWTLA